MDIHVFEVEPWEKEHFKGLEEKGHLHLHEESLQPENADQFNEAEVISTFINSDMSEESVGKLGKLKFIATRSTGFDHICVDHCRQRGIQVSNVPTYGRNTVAEHVFGLLLMISHRLEEAVNRTRKGDFSPRGLQGFDLQGKTFGVIGTGDIGLEALRIARGFGMDTCAYDVVENTDAAQELDFRYLSLEEVLATSDVISLHVPANDKTRHMIGEDEFGAMKKGVVLINTARGAVVETRALLRALAEGKVAAAGLDVLPDEPVIREEAELLRSVYEREHNLETLLADHVLVHMHNVVVTPHSAFNTKEAVQRILDTTVENIVTFLDNGEPRNLVIGDEG